MYQQQTASPTSPAMDPAARRSLFIVLMSAAVLFVNNGFIVTGITAFDSELLTRFHVSVGALKLRDTFTFGTVAVAGPLAGYLLDRIGLKPLMVIGMLLMAIGMAMYSRADDIYALYAIHILFGLCLVTAGLFANVILVAASTNRHRGLSIGFIIAGSSFGQAIAPRINDLLAMNLGWRHALLVDAVTPLLIIPGILLIFPRLKGSTSFESDDPNVPGVTYKAALTHRNFWLLSITAAIGFCVQLGVVTNMVLFVERDLRLGGAAASGAVFLLFISALTSQIGAGFLADRFGSRIVHVTSLVIMACGCACLTMGTPGWMWIGALLFGLGWGGNYSLIQLLTSNLFLGPAIGRIMGTIAVIESVGAASGPYAIGALYDSAGTYSVPFGISTVLILLCVLAVRALDLPPRRQAGAPPHAENPHEPY